MRELYVDENWSFEEAIDNIKTLRTEYEEVLASFSYFDLKKEIEFRKNTRNKFYRLNLQEYYINKLWEYMNRYEFLYVLKSIASRRNKK